MHISPTQQPHKRKIVASQFRGGIRKRGKGARREYRVGRGVKGILSLGLFFYEWEVGKGQKKVKTLSPR